MKPWCAEGDLPTSANLNLYRGWNSCVGWHCDDEPLFGKCGDAKLIVSVSLGSFALFMDGQCQDEFLHRTSPGRDQERINITFRWVKQHVSSCPLFKAGVACCLPTCAQGSSVPVMVNASCGVFFFFFFFFFFLFFLVSSWCLVHMVSSGLCWSPCCVQDLGYLGVPSAGHALWVVFSGGITFVTSGGNTSKFKKLPACILGYSGISGYGSLIC